MCSCVVMIVSVGTRATVIKGARYRNPLGARRAQACARGQRLHCCGHAANEQYEVRDVCDTLLLLTSHY